MRRIILSLFLFSSAALAQSPPAADLTTDPKNLTVAGTIVVTAAALPESTASTTSAVTVISREEIERRKVRDVATLLRTVPGLSVSRSGSEGKATSLFTRGAGSTQTLVLWNGIQLNNPYFSGYDWGRVSTAGVQQVEVVRGPFSALYGSEAMAGVVNVLAAPLGNHLGVDVQGGGRGLRNAATEGSFSTSSLSGSASFEHRSDDGFHPNDDFRQKSANAALTWKAAHGLSVGVQGRHTDFALGIPFNVNAAGDELVPSLLRRQKGTEQLFAVPVRWSGARAGAEVTLSEARHTDLFNDPDDPFGFTASSTASRTRRVQGSFRFASIVGTLIAGADIERSLVNDSSVFGSNLQRDERRGNAFFLEDRWSRQLGTSARFDLTAGVRRDSFDGCAPATTGRCTTADLGSQTSPRIGAAVSFGSQKIRASYGEGFRAPSIGELYFPYSGNRDLAPERSSNWELGYDYTLPQASMTVTLFDSRYRNLITFDNASYAFANIGRAKARGVELGAARVFGPLTANLSYTFLQTHGEDERTLLRRPKHSGSIVFGYDRGANGLSLEVVHAGARADILPVFPYSRISNEAHTTADVMLQRHVGALTPYIRVENVTDERYQEVRGYDSPGRRALIGLHYTVK